MNEFFPLAIWHIVSDVIDASRNKSFQHIVESAKDQIKSLVSKRHLPEEFLEELEHVEDAVLAHPDIKNPSPEDSTAAVLDTPVAAPQEIDYEKLAAAIEHLRRPKGSL